MQKASQRKVIDIGGNIVIYAPYYEKYDMLSYRFEKDFLSSYLQIVGIGKEERKSHRYRYHGLKRDDQDGNNCYLFQYTLSGKGTIRIDKKYALPPGHAFIVEIPSDHEYYLDIEDDRWEFIYIMLRGEWVKTLVRKAVETTGNIFDVAEDSRLSHLLYSIFANVQQRNITDYYEASGLAYLFLMELLRLTSNATSANTPVLIKRTLEVIKNEYRSIDSIEALASKMGVSKSHLIRVFSKHLGSTPGQYLARTRMEHALILLQNTETSLDEIAHSIGISSGNYFGKLFKQHYRITTQEYRKRQYITL